MNSLSISSAFWRWYHSGVSAVAIFFIICTPGLLHGSPRNVEFTQSAQNVDTYDFVEITLNAKNPDAENPFVDATIEGWFAADDGQKVHVDGFCDSPDGKIFRIRFMPSEPGKYHYIDRLSRLKINRLRVAINGRVKNGRAWYENVFPTEKFTFLLNPWSAKQPDSVEKPGFDVTRLNVGYWRKIERMLRHAREKDMVISLRGNTVITEVGGHTGVLVAFDKKTGRPLWRSASQEPSGHNAGPVPVSLQGIKCLASFGIRKLTVVGIEDQKRGKTLAQHPWRTAYACNIVTPAVTDNKVILSSGHDVRRTALLQISPGKVRQLWSSRFWSEGCSPVIHKGCIYRL